MEFGALSRLTGDPIYEEVALHALHSLYNHRSSIGLLGNHIDVQTGTWTAQDAGIGAGVDSYYEYLVKGAIMLNRPELLQMFHEGRAAIDKYLKRDDWHIWASMSKGQLTLPVFQSLQAFWPGLLSLIGDVNSAMRSLHNMHSVWKQYGFLPEFYNIPQLESGTNRESYPLRPELIESVMYLYRATGDPYLLEVGEDILKSIQYSAKTKCGYATIKNVKDHRKQDTMESFFLAETTKYLYLLYDPDNFLNNDGGYGTLLETENGECIIESSYIFNTEAHPIDVGALKCCYDVPRESLVKGFNRKLFMGDATATFDRSNVEHSEDFSKQRDIEAQDEVQSTDDFKKALVSEIMSALSNAKRKIEENAELQKRFIEITNREKDGRFDLEKNVVDLSKSRKKRDEVDTPTAEDSSQENSELSDESIEIVKLPTGSVDVDTLKKVDIEDDTRSEENLTKPSIDSKRIVDIPSKSSDSNNSILTDFVQAILKTTLQPKPFDPQLLLGKIRENRYPRNESWETKYELLSCKAQRYAQRMSVMGEF